MILINGTLHKQAPQEELFGNRGLLYGDAIFETLKVSGGKLLFWEDHYFRLMSSMRIMRMEIPLNFTMETLESQLLELAKNIQPELQAVRLKLLVYRDSEGLYTPKENTIGYTITGSVLEVPFYTLAQTDYLIELFKDHYLSPSLISTLKTNNKALNVLGSIYAKENDYQNCLILNTNKEVVEALNGNIFLVHGNQIKTPPRSSGCLQGIMRKQIMALVEKLPDYTLVEAVVSPFELQQADEIFITNVIGGIIPVSAYRKKSYNNTVARDLLGKLNAKIRLG